MYHVSKMPLVKIRAGAIHLTHESIHLGHDSIQFDSNEYSIVVNRFGANLFVSNLNEF